MNKRIVVPLDGSELSEMALPHAAALAQAMGHSLTLLRVATPPSVLNSTAWGTMPNNSIYEGWEEDLRNEGQYLDVLAENLRAKGIDIQAALVQGDPAESIVSYAEQHPDVALIAMSTHGRSGLSRWVFGSVAEKVLHASPVPLLLVHPKRGETPSIDFQVPRYKSLLVPLDGSYFAAQALDFAKDLAPKLGAGITLVSAIADQFFEGELVVPPALPHEWPDETDLMYEYFQQCRKSLATAGLSVGTRLEYGPPADAILHVAESLQVDPSLGSGEVLTVMATHGRTGLPRLWMGSVAMKVVQASPRPVLLVRAKERVKEVEPALAAIALTPAI